MVSHRPTHGCNPLVYEWNVPRETIKHKRVEREETSFYSLNMKYTHSVRWRKRINHTVMNSSTTTPDRSFKLNAFTVHMTLLLLFLVSMSRFRNTPHELTDWQTSFFIFFFLRLAICSLAEKTTHSSSIENALVSLRPRYIGVDTLSYSGHDRAIEHVHGGGEPKKNATNFHNIGTTDGGACSNAAWAKSRGGERAWKSNATEH